MAKKEPSQSMVVSSRVKDLVKSWGLRSEGELPDAVSAKVAELLKAAADRTKANGRSTVRGSDL
jgi:histone H3/H4